MKPWERVIKAMQRASPDRVPLYEMHIPPKIAGVILGRSPCQIMLHNPEVFFKLAAEKRVDLDSINKQIADELVSLYMKLGIDWIRVVGAHTYVPREVKRLGEREWLVDGRLLVWSGETLWDPQMLWDAGGVLDADSLLRYCRSAKPEVNPKVFDVLREVFTRLLGPKGFETYYMPAAFGFAMGHGVLYWITAIIAFFTRALPAIPAHLPG